MTVRAALEDETKGMLPDERDRFLETVSRHFPVWGEIVNSESKSSNRIDPNDIPVLVTALVSGFLRLSNGQQNEIRQMLVKGGVLGSGGVGQEQRVREVASVFRRNGTNLKDSNLAIQRLLDVFLMLAEQVIATEEFVSPCWRNYRSEGGSPLIRELIGRYIWAGENDAALGKCKVDLQDQLVLLKNRLVKLLSSIPAFARRFSQTRCPSAIEEGVQGKWGMFPGKFKDVWDRYIELCGGRDQEQFDDQIVAIFRQILKDL
ncbi:MAG: hypothetical protein ABSB42_07790 [Tepidisphaeraceae bacterium]